jgi:ribosomal protein S6
MEDISKEDPMKKAYEVSFLLESEDHIADVKRLVAQHGADITQESPQRKINLAYPIEHATQAFFGVLKVMSEPGEMKLLEKDLVGSKKVLRSLIIVIPKEKSGEGEEAKRPTMPVRRASPVQREQKSKPLSNEAIERKIEEISQ